MHNLRNLGMKICTYRTSCVTSSFILIFWGGKCCLESSRLNPEVASCAEFHADEHVNLDKD